MSNESLTKSTLVFEGESKPIECTPEHPFFILNADSDTPTVLYENAPENSEGAWVAAKHLKAGHICLLSSGKTAILKSNKFEQLDKPFATYNFEVADFHTYHVGEQGILVHNACPVEPGTKEWNQAVKDIRNSANSRGKLNYTVKDQATAQRLAGEAGLKYQGTYNGSPYVHGEMAKAGLTPYSVGYEIHIADNAVRLPHLRFWSGRSNGHIYWLGG